MEYLLHLAVLICIYLILAQSYNFVFGLGRIFNLAHVASYALGAYTVAILMVDYEFSSTVALAFSFIGPTLIALLLGGISIRLTSDYFSIGSLAFSALVSAILINFKSLTRGVLGIPGIPRPTMFGAECIENRDFLMFAGAIAFGCQVLLYFLFRSPLARSLRAQAGFEIGSQALGMNTAMIRYLAFILSSAFAGVAGGLYALYVNYIDPSSFTLTEMVFVLTICVVGKPGSFWGVIASTFFMVLLPEPLRFLEIPSGVLGPVRQMLYALLLVGVIYLRRKELFPQVRKV